MISPQVHSPPSPPDIGADPLDALSPATRSPCMLVIHLYPAVVVALGSQHWGQHPGGLV